MNEIMIVDDDEDLRESMAEVLAGGEFAVTQAARGEEALNLIEHRKFDLILLDMVMPGLSGMEVLGRIRQKFPRMPVVMISAFASVGSAVEAMRQGASDYVTKPFRVDGLLTAVRRSLEEARFATCRAEFNIDAVLSCLANAIRRGILASLEREGAMRFMDICRRVEIEDHTKVNFHLKILKEAGFLAQDERKLYVLTAHGLRVMDCARFLIKKLSS
jgi:DNA-binding response OmpR family regulator